VKVFAFGNPVYDDIRTPWVCTIGRVLSGCATNAAFVYRRLGGEVTVVGRVGRDRLDHYRSYLTYNGINEITDPCNESGGFGLDYDDRGRRELTILGRADAIARIPADIEKADIVFIGPVMQETPLNLVREIRERTQAPIFLDPQGLLRRIGANGKVEHFKPEGIEEICALCDVVKPNELETEILTGIDPRVDLEGAATILKGWGIRTLAITLAELGALIVSEDGWHRVDAIPTHAIDSTGAGDTFAGGLMFARSQGYSWSEAAKLATACSSTMISNCGPDFVLTFDDAKKRAATVGVTKWSRAAVGSVR
jgi:sugar/nucleoside kinase (ribokinase family)